MTHNPDERLGILAAADLHGVRRFYRGIARRARGEDVDAVVLAGDLSARGERALEEDLLGELLSADKPVLFIMGNDDDSQWPDRAPMVNINRKRKEVRGVPFVGYQYTDPFVGGPFERSDAAQERDFFALARLIDEGTVLVTHGPERGVLDRTFRGERVGSRALARLVSARAPRYHLFGHIHDAWGAEGRSFNVAAAVSGRALLLEYYSGSFEFIPIG